MHVKFNYSLFNIVNYFEHRVCSAVGISSSQTTQYSLGCIYFFQIMYMYHSGIVCYISEHELSAHFHSINVSKVIELQEMQAIMHFAYFSLIIPQILHYCCSHCC